MPSPFPGMDPFIEMQEWSDFHATYMTVIREMLTPQVRPRYVVRVERRVYLEQAFGEPEQMIPDVAILERRGISRPSSAAALLDETMTAIAPSNACFRQWRNFTSTSWCCETGRRCASSR